MQETNTVRLANYDDLPELADMSEKFFNSTPYPKLDEFNKEETFATLRSLLALQPLGKALLLVSTKDNKAVGMLIAIANKTLWSSSTQVTEVAWYVSEEDRETGMGKKLIEGYDFWAKMINAKMQSMSIIESLDPDGVLKDYLVKNGYTASEQALVRKV